MMICCRLLKIFLLLHISIPTMMAQGNSSTDRVATNLEVMQNLVGQIAQEIVQQSHIPKIDSVVLMLRGSNDDWIARSVLVSKMKEAGYQVFDQHDTSVGKKYSIEILAAAFQVRYTDMFHDGFLGSKKVKRNITTSLTYQTNSDATHEILSGGTIAEQAIDTVEVDNIRAVELASVQSTHGELPAETFIDRVLEPLIIIGATGVTVYLFFHVRS